MRFIITAQASADKKATEQQSDLMRNSSSSGRTTFWRLVNWQARETCHLKFSNWSPRLRRRGVPRLGARHAR